MLGKEHCIENKLKEYYLDLVSFILNLVKRKNLKYWIGFLLCFISRYFFIRYAIKLLNTRLISNGQLISVFLNAYYSYTRKKYRTFIQISKVFI